MSQRPKYKAKYVFWDSNNRSVKSEHDINIYRCHGKLKLPGHIWRFDSQHEFKVYLQLVRMYGVDRISRQVPLPIIKKGYCYPKGKIWKVDFGVTSRIMTKGISLYVEAKGAFLPEFITTLALLEQSSKIYFECLRVISLGEIPKNNRVIKSLLNSPFKRNLLTLQEVEKLKELP